LSVQSSITEAMAFRQGYDCDYDDGNNFADDDAYDDDYDDEEYLDDGIDELTDEQYAEDCCKYNAADDDDGEESQEK
jgi:hypothetical protein